MGADGQEFAGSNHEPDAASGNPSGGVTRRDVLQGVNAGLIALGAATIVPGAAAALVAQDTKAAVGKFGPRKVRDVENIWIPMSDGVKIAARLWLPEDADKSPAPALLEYIPYRKRDDTRLDNEHQHPYYASYGYACIRPDIRGSGDSEGLPMDEYEKPEQDDGVEIIAWLTKQPWCNGKVGMFGISWGGFSSLQVAARHPPALKAIITHCSTDDRYTDDAHYTGGCINECMFLWGAIHTLDGPRPPDPAIVGPRWREMWKNRLNHLDFYVGNWLNHQHRDAFWKHASVNEDYSQIKCAVYAVGGWADPYRCTVERMLTNLQCPRKGLVGPWAHAYPHEATDPGPAIDWLTEALRWWDYWLKGIDTGIMKEPMYRAWMQHEPAMRGMKNVPGRWVAEDIWPSARIKPSAHYLTALGLGAAPAGEAVRTLASPQTVGVTAPLWWEVNITTDLPGDQRMDDGRSLTFDSEPLIESFEILGAPIVTLNVAVDKPVAFLAVRLNEVEPDGVSKRITYNILNLTHRESHEFPQPLEPGQRYRIRIQLQDCAHRFSVGSRIRLAMSTTYWPAFWPSPEAVILTIYTGESTLELPVRPPRPQDEQLHPFGAAFVPKDSGSTPIETERRWRDDTTQEWDISKQQLTVRASGAGAIKLNATGTELRSSVSDVSVIRDDDPQSAKLESKWSAGYRRPDWDVNLKSELRISLTKDNFLLFGSIRAYEGEEEVFSRSWDRKIPRQLV